MQQQNSMSSQGYNNMRPSFSNSQMLLQQPQRRYNVKVDKTIGPVILRYDIFLQISLYQSSVTSMAF